MCLYIAYPIKITAGIETATKTSQLFFERKAKTEFTIIKENAIPKVKTKAIGLTPLERDLDRGL